MDINTQEAFVILIAGLAAGFVNTLAGSGSLFTLPAFIFLGLPADIANGTNRVGLLMQAVTGIFTFSKEKFFDFKRDFGIVGITTLGAIAGSFLAVDIPMRTLEIVMGTFMLILLLPMLIDFKKIFAAQTTTWNGIKNPFLVYFLFFLLGIYGGFIQAGVGIFMYLSLTYLRNYTVIEANALKILIIFLYTIPVFCVFAWNGKINWELGILMGIAQSVGAWIAAKLTLKGGQTAVWINRIIIVMILLSAIKLFGGW